MSNVNPQSNVSQTLRLESLAAQMRRGIMQCTTAAGSGHPTSSLSAVELMTALFFGGHFRFDVDNPSHPNNDRLIFSKGHASPLFYSMWAAAGQISDDELKTYRQFGSVLEGHPTSRFKFAEAATGSLGQGLSIGLGMALNAKYLDKLPYRTFVLLGDSEMAEGSQWEAIQLAAHYKLNNLIGILDVNRLGQRGETMCGYDLRAYQKRVEAFGWRSIIINDGHDLDELQRAYDRALEPFDAPVMLIAKTIKGKGISYLENDDNWHGKSIAEDKLNDALNELPPINETLTGKLSIPDDSTSANRRSAAAEPMRYELGKQIATRQAYGNAITRIACQHTDIVALDGEVSNSTGASTFKESYPERFFEMFIAEQNMVGAAVGLAQRGRLPFVSTFAAFFSRAYDQIRMSQYGDANVKYVGSHCGVSIGEDGPSQMGLEDIAMFRVIQNSVVLYPCDAVATEHLVEAMANHVGISYLRTTRGKTPVIYDTSTSFHIGGCHVLKQSDNDKVTIVTAGITVHEALKAYEILSRENIKCRIIDLYSIKPIDCESIIQAADETGAILTVEDHFPEGGLGEAVRSCFSRRQPLIDSIAVQKRPMSGTPEELLDAQGLSASAIAAAARSLVQRS